LQTQAQEWICCTTERGTTRNVPKIHAQPCNTLSVYGRFTLVGLTVGNEGTYSLLSRLVGYDTDALWECTAELQMTTTQRAYVEAGSKSTVPIQRRQKRRGHNQTNRQGSSEFAARRVILSSESDVERRRQRGIVTAHHHKTGLNDWSAGIRGPGQGERKVRNLGPG
jgi:hypothetical protein